MQMTEDELSIKASEMSICNLPKTAIQQKSLQQRRIN